jgi:DNA-binding PadR family transcriptional regulator
MIVRREIEERTGRNLSIGAVYATLERLEAKGYVSSFTGDPTPERGGRSKRLFRVEAAGERALQISNRTIRSMTAGLKGHWGRYEALFAAGFRLLKRWYRKASSRGTHCRISCQVVWLFGPFDRLW